MSIQLTAVRSIMARSILACTLGLVLELTSFGTPSLRLSGSDAFADWLPHSLSKQLADLRIEYHLIGSEIGLSALKADKADACLYISTGDSPSSIPDTFHSEIIAYLVLYLYADDAFPDYAISKDTILHIADRSSLTPIDHWTEVFNDTNHTWQAKPAEILVDQSDSPYISAYFRLAFLGSAKPSIRVRLCDHKAQVENLMNQNRGCIIVSPRSTFYLRGTKQLQIRESNHEAAFPPSYENIHYGDYSARFPVYLISSKTSSSVSSLRSVLRSKAFQDSLRENWLIPAEESP